MKPSEMNDQELVEAFFVEAHGMEPILTEEFNFQVHFTGSGRYFERLPNILDSESAFNEWVLPVMEERGLSLWIRDDGAEWVDCMELYEARVEIKNNRRLRAAVEAVLEIVMGRGEVTNGGGEND